MENQQKRYYKEKYAKVESALQRSKRIVRMLAIVRLLSFLIIFASIFVVIPRMLIPGLILAVSSLFVFLFLIKAYLKRDGMHKHLNELLKINELEIKALEYKYDSFDPGDEFMDTTHPYSYDMDLFGKGSVFQFINRTVTQLGRSILADFLSKETLSSEKIIDRQYAVKELALMPDIVQDFQASGKIIEEDANSNHILKDWVQQPNYYTERKFFLILAKLIPVLTISSIVLAVFSPSIVAIPVVLYLLQLFIIGSRFQHTSQNHQIISKRLETLRKYYALLINIEKGEYAGKELSSIYATLFTEQNSASKSIFLLTKIVAAFDSRLNILAALFLEGLFLWDIQCMIRLERWKKNQGSKLNEWIVAIAKYDALASLSTYAFNHPEFSYPQFSEKGILIAEEMGHILIAPHERVCNDFEIAAKGNFILITGANMAGKSTFLRTVATNMILAMAGAPVCAKNFSFHPQPLFSSMRTSDSLNKHESYFYAELKRLKELLDRLKEGENLFIILDEILKGTNSTDKQKGSRAALEQIVKLGGTGIIATHDLELAGIEKDFPGQVKNLCFEIDIDEAKISFDYKLKAGITTKMNALLLMQQMGIIQGLD